jgi:hypothetical protein
MPTLRIETPHQDGGSMVITSEVPETTIHTDIGEPLSEIERPPATVADEATTPIPDVPGTGPEPPATIEIGEPLVEISRPPLSRELPPTGIHAGEVSALGIGMLGVGAVIAKIAKKRHQKS